MGRKSRRTSRAPKSAASAARRIQKPVGPAKSPLPAEDQSKPLIVAAIALLLVVAVVGVFGQTARDEFINCDDNQYVYMNLHVKQGVTWDGIGWAFTKSYSANWHPLTWISHMIDCQWSPVAKDDAFQTAPLHHITSVALHAAAAVLLLLAMRKLTGRLWPSAFVAAVFAVHPLHVESVAWVAERKDVLSGVFFMATLWAYAAYARRPGWLRYLLVLLLFALGLMAKPMLVTLPCVLLLLDYWPLGRLGLGQQRRGPPAWKVVLEKLPMFCLSAASCWLTIWAQSQVYAFKNDSLSLPWRAGNALVSYAQYIRQTFWPTGMAAYYPHMGIHLPLWQIAASAALLAAITAAAVLLARKCGYFLVGWLMFLGMLVPVIGLTQVGAQARADRYMYLPQIGLAIIVAWGALDLTKRFSAQKILCGSLAAAAIAAMVALGFRQTAFWRTSETLWRHAIECTDRNDYAYVNLGMVLATAGKNDEAIDCYRKAIAYNPDYGLPHNKLGTLFYAQGKIDEAAGECALAVLADPHSAEAHNNLGVMLYLKKMNPQAVVQFEQALQEDAEYTLALRNLGKIRAENGKVEAGIACFRRALEINPRYADAHHDLGMNLEKLGRLAEAAAELQTAIELGSKDLDGLLDLACLRAAGADDKVRDGAEAVALATRLCAATGGKNPAALRVLAAAYAEAGKFPQAIETAEKALAPLPPESPLAQEIRAELQFYRQGKPLRLPAPRAR